jgi:hypothetical protein
VIAEAVGGTPLVSVGILTYNRPEDALPTLRAIADQRYGNLQIIVSDNASPDRRTDRALAGIVSPARWSGQRRLRGQAVGWQPWVKLMCLPFLRAGRASISAWDLSSAENAVAVGILRLTVARLFFNHEIRSRR